jgi:rhomboid protease GluP
MNKLSQSAYYWQLIHYFVTKKGLRLFKVSSDEQEIFLELEDTKETTAIRIICQDIDGSNYIARDIEKLAKQGEKIRKELKSRSLTIINVYISDYLPVDDYQAVLDKVYLTKNKRIKIQSYIIGSEGDSKSALDKLSETLEVSLEDFDSRETGNFEEDTNFREEVVTISEQRSKKEKDLFSYGKPLFTYLILISLLVTFGLMEYYGSSTSLLTLVEFGAKYDPLIYQGEWWRFFTAIFLHIGFFHLLMNSIALYYLGSAVEKIYGTSRFIVIYVIAGLFGSISSFAFNSQVSAGASGAIFGCFGALLCFGVIHRKLFFRTMGVNLIVILIINLGFGFMMPMIDNSAHIGGLIGGFLASSFLYLPKYKLKKRQFVAFFVTVLSVTVLLSYGFYTEEDPEKTHLINVQISQALIQRDEGERAYQLLKKAVDDDVEIVEARFLLAYCEAKLGYLKDAEKNLLITIEERPLLHEGHFNLSLVYFELSQYLDALYSVETALDIKPDREDYLNLKEMINEQLIEIESRK